MNDKRFRERDRPQRDDPHDSLANIHADVHHLRKDIREAIEKSQTAVMNTISLLSAKVDKLGTGGITPDETAALAALTVEGEAIAVRLEKLNALN